MQAKTRLFALPLVLLAGATALAAAKPNPPVLGQAVPGRRGLEAQAARLLGLTPPELAALGPKTDLTQVASKLGVSAGRLDSGLVNFRDRQIAALVRRHFLTATQAKQARSVSAEVVKLLTQLPLRDLTGPGRIPGLPMNRPAAARGPLAQNHPGLPPRFHRGARSGMSGRPGPFAKALAPRPRAPHGLLALIRTDLGLLPGEMVPLLAASHSLGALAAQLGISPQRLTDELVAARNAKIHLAEVAGRISAARANRMEKVSVPYIRDLLTTQVPLR